MVMVAMSGGVDSAAAAILLKKQGLHVEGVTFDLFSGGDAPIKAGRICHELGIKHHVIDLKELFERRVVSEFARGYAKGITPNPCVLCNETVKFGAFYDWAMANGAGAIATGHYARIAYIGGKPRVARAADLCKDQSYVLYTIPGERLRKIRFPLGDMSKNEARSIASEQGVSIEGGESQDICFVPNGGYAEFLADRGVASPEGDFVDAGGRVLGRHKGIIHYTVGQRKGIGLSAPEFRYIRRIDADSNTIRLCGHCELFERKLTAKAVHVAHPEDLESPRRITAKIRYGTHEAPAVALLLENGSLAVEFDQPQRAITPGQSVVVYDGDMLIGGGVIVADK